MAVYVPGAYRKADGRRRWEPGHWADQAPETLATRAAAAARMAAAAADTSTREQLEELAEARGGIYQDALFLLGETGSTIENQTTGENPGKEQEMAKEHSTDKGESGGRCRHRGSRRGDRDPPGDQPQMPIQLDPSRGRCHKVPGWMSQSQPLATNGDGPPGREARS
jgi:hypothetical protein